MMARFTAVLFSLLAFAALSTGSASAQSPGWQTVTGSTGYQFQVPPAWKPGSVDKPEWRYVTAPDASGSAWVMSMPQYLYNGSPSSVIQDLNRQGSSETDFQRGDPSSTSVSGASTASVAVASARSVNSGNIWNSYIEAALSGDTIYVLTVYDTADYDQQNPSVATTILQSLQVGMGIAPVASQSSPPPPGIPVGTTLLFDSGSGSRETDTFFNSTGRVQVCWTMSGRSPSGSLGPDLSINLDAAGPDFDSASITAGNSSQDCSYAHLKPGSYYAKMFATPWTNWTVTITAA